MDWLGKKQTFFIQRKKNIGMVRKNACKKSWNGVILPPVKILEWCDYEKKDVSNRAEMEAGRTRQKGLDD